MNVLLLCRENCLVSRAAIKHLESFTNWNVTKIEGSERGKAELPDNE